MYLTVRCPLYPHAGKYLRNSSEERHGVLCMSCISSDTDVTWIGLSLDSEITHLSHPLEMKAIKKSGSISEGKSWSGNTAVQGGRRKGGFIASWELLLSSSIYFFFMVSSMFVPVAQENDTETIVTLKTIWEIRIVKQFHKNMSCYCRKIPSRLVFKSCVWSNLGVPKQDLNLRCTLPPISPAISPSGWKWFHSLGRWQ